MNQKRFGANFAAAMAAALILAACGGGGSSDPKPNPPPDPVPGGADIVTEVPTPTYAANGPQATVFKQLNDLRAKIGSGLLAQDAQLDLAAANHFNYVVLNGYFGYHTEDPAKPGYTGVTPAERARNAGYAGSAGESMFGALGADRAAECVPVWANSVYHMVSLFMGDRDVGIAAGNVKANGPAGEYTETYCVLEVGTKDRATSPRPVAGTVLVYPYDQQTSVPYLFQNRQEYPQPLPELDGVGHPIAAWFATQANANPKVTVSAYTVTAQGGASVAAKVMAHASVNVAAGIDRVVDDVIWPQAVFIVPVAPLTPSTTYTVSFEGTVDGAAVKKNWSFTTAAAK